MTLRVVFRRAALTEFEDAADWYETRRRGLGEEFVAEVTDAIERAADRPQQHPVVYGDVRRTVCRRFPFAIYFRVRGESLVVLAVFHARPGDLEAAGVTPSARYPASRRCTWACVEHDPPLPVTRRPERRSSLDFDYAK